MINEEMETMQICVKCKPNVLEIYSYFMYHSFKGVTGAVRLGISFLFLGTAFITLGQTERILTILMVLIGILNPVVTPIMLYVRAKNQEKKELMTEYRIDQEEVIVSRNGTRRKLAWTSFPLIVWNSKALILYVDSNKALLLPKRQMEGKEQGILEILQHLPESCNVKLRKNQMLP